MYLLYFIKKGAETLKNAIVDFIALCANTIHFTYDKLKTEIELNRGIGRPKEGNTYGKDKSPFGRDPLGDKENHNALKHRTSEQRALKMINGIAAKRKFLHETKGMLDESNIIDNE